MMNVLLLRSRFVSSFDIAHSTIDALYIYIHINAELQPYMYIGVHQFRTPKLFSNNCGPKSSSSLYTHKLYIRIRIPVDIIIHYNIVICYTRPHGPNSVGESIVWNAISLWLYYYTCSLKLYVMWTDLVLIKISKSDGLKL